MRRAIRGVAVAIVLGSVAGAAWTLRPPVQRSDVITEAWPAIENRPWLKADLRDAVVWLPDRPHTHDEATRARRGELALERTRSYRVSTNADRLRGPAIGPKAPGTTRIVALGDSVTHGWGVTYEEAYPARLEAVLRARGHAVEVINAGVPANTLDTMEAWCAGPARALSPDVVLWTRRLGIGPDPYADYARGVASCARATGARLVVVLPPVSSFDLHGSGVYRAELAGLSERLAPGGVPVVELTDVFRAAQAGRGERLERAQDQLRVVDQESGKAWLEVPAGRGPELPAEIHALFERAPDVREALFFDEGHPDAEGFVVFAEAVADALAPLLAGGAPPASDAPGPGPAPR